MRRKPLDPARRRLSLEERVLLRLRAKGKCEQCGCDLDASFHADHVQPWSKGGRTLLSNMQALCPSCNLRKGSSMLRAHQKEMQSIARREACGTEFFQTIAHVTPGGGKSVLPFILGHSLYRRGIIEKILWLVPRDSLREQAEEQSMKAFLKTLGADVMPLEKVSGNGALGGGWPADGYGLVSTHQAVTSANLPYLTLMAETPTLMVVDEAHHVVQGSTTAAALAPLYEQAAYLLLLTGTLQRNIRTEKILGVSYESDGGKFMHPVILPQTQDIVYTRTDALKEKAILPIYYERVDGNAWWTDTKTNKQCSVESLMDAGEDEASALTSILNSDYCETLLDQTVTHWKRFRTDPLKQNAKLLVVAPNRPAAREYRKYLKSQGLRVGLAITRESGELRSSDPDPLDEIKKFKKPNTGSGYEVLVSVGMAYEGLDVPPITHIACLTRTRSYPWIEQMLARATRFDPSMGSWESQAAYVFAPADKRLSAVIEKIRLEQAAVAIKPTKGPDGPTPEPKMIIPGGGTVTSAYAEDGQTGEIISGADYTRLNVIRETSGYTGSLEQLKNLLAISRSYDEDADAGLTPQQAASNPTSHTVMTQSEQRAKYSDSLRSAVNKAMRGYFGRSDTGAIIKEVQNTVNDRLGVRSRDLKQTMDVSLDKLAETVDWAHSRTGQADLRMVADMTARGARRA